MQETTRIPWSRQRPTSRRKYATRAGSSAVNPAMRMNVVLRVAIVRIGQVQARPFAGDVADAIGHDLAALAQHPEFSLAQLELHRHGIKTAIGRGGHRADWKARPVHVVQVWRQVC